MNANFSATAKARIAAFAAAVLTSTIVLGATVAGMQPAEQNPTVVALERVVVTASHVN